MELFNMSNDKPVVLEPYIPDFIAYCSEKKWELPFPGTEETTTENRKRTGAKEGLYPKLYFAGQYPAEWKVPAAADSAYYQSLKK